MDACAVEKAVRCEASTASSNSVNCLLCGSCTRVSKVVSPRISPYQGARGLVIYTEVRGTEYA